MIICIVYCVCEFLLMMNPLEKVHYLTLSIVSLQTLKRKEREFEHEMERLAREKIALQQRLSTLKKDMLGKWDHLDWRSMVPEDIEMEMDTDSATSVEYGNGRKSLRKPSSPSEATLPPKNDSDQDESNDSQHPLSLTLNNCRG
jgi:predicted transcriptional regulator